MKPSISKWDGRAWISYTPDGSGKVIGLNILDISMQVKIEGLEQPLEYKMEEIEAFN